ncbi:MAG: hypothetical protein ABSB19_12870 [Methylomonas sp.]|jgi:hypothetical protein
MAFPSIPICDNVLYVTLKYCEWNDFSPHPAARILVHEYLETASHGVDDADALFRPVKNSADGGLDSRKDPLVIDRL